jgi:hypothetical protein
MGFNFNTFMQNFTQTAINGARVYESKQSEGKSLHGADYINLGVMGLVAILSAFASKEVIILNNSQYKSQCLTFLRRIKVDIYVKAQTTAAINIVLGLGINTGAPDTGATVSCKAIKPDGTEATFTAPTITEVIASSGVYLFVFPTNAATPLFTLADEANPYTLLIKSATSGSTYYRTIRVYVVTKLPVNYAGATELATVDSLVDSLTTNLATVDGIVDDIKAEVLTHPTLAEIEATTVLAKAADLATVDGIVDTLTTNMDFLLDVIKNKKELRKESSVWYLCVRNDADNADILKKAVKDSTGANITDLTAGMIASELASSI